MSKCIKYVLENTSPVRIGNDESSQFGQTDTLCYLTGSTIRGMIIQYLLTKPEFEKEKTLLFSNKVRFLNAYFSINGKEMYPSFKGFHEDKTESQGKKAIENAFCGELSFEVKKASLGHFCYVDKDCLHYASVMLGDDIGIKKGKKSDSEDSENGENSENNENKKIFRAQYIKRNQRFIGYILFDDEIEEAFINKIDSAFNGILSIGNRRSAGYGMCKCISHEICEENPYKEVRSAKDSRKFYMILMSDTVMRNQFGEYVGIDLETISKELGCQKVKLLHCETSVKKICGYNRNWNGFIPSVEMYGAGSVFCMEADKVIEKEKFRLLEKKGIGIRKNEGYGQIAFFQEYEEIKSKVEEKNENIKTSKKPALEEKIEGIEVAAKGLLVRRLNRAIERYVVKEKLALSGVSDSQLGVVESICIEMRYEPAEKTRQKFFDLMENITAKDQRLKVHNGKARQRGLTEYISSILNGDLCEILGLDVTDKKVLNVDLKELLTEDEIMRYKLKIMEKQIRYKNRKGKNV